MKFSESWLREWVDPAIDTEALVSRITMAGLEVDGVEPAAAAFSGVIVGEILTAEQHPDADKLRVCSVSGANGETFQVVCGAPNARAGIKIPFATIGAVLPGDFKIKKAKLRGVESFGMLCAEKELGISDADEGLWELPASAPVGEDLRAYLKLNDNLIEVDLTPNRGDCLSIKGLAREVGVLCNEDVISPDMALVHPTVDDTFPVTLSAGDACPRYVGRVIRGIDITVESPLWLQEKLRRSGLRTIDPVVDVTNFVLLELGQPMHAFDLAQLDGGITVRPANAGESLKLLDGSEQKLRTDTLVIADKSKALAMAGIMGGESSAVSSQTRDVFLECAYFSPLAIAGKARNYGLHTDSSHRFERGVDPELCFIAVERATQLLLDIVGGRAGPVVCEEVASYLPEIRTVELTRKKLASQLAIDLEDTQVTEIFRRLGLDVLENTPDGWTTTVPSWRFDISIDADLVEEIARIYGYNNLPTTTLAGEMEIRPKAENTIATHALKTTLVDCGFREVITYSFVDPKLARAIDPEGRFVEVKNPISSDMAVMRTSLWPGLIDTLKRNLSRQQTRARLFEMGLRFLHDGEHYNQQRMIGGLIYGDREAESWTQTKGKVDFYDLKGYIEALLMLSADPSRFVFKASEHPALHPGQCAAIYCGEALAGYAGRIHPSVEKQLGLDQPAYLFEMLVAPLCSAKIPRYEQISRYPEVRRDLAIVIDDGVPAADIVNCAREAAGELLAELKIFDVYEGKGIENNRKSIALGLTFQDQSRTLNESEVTDSVNAVIEALKTTYQATLRG